MKNKIGLKNKVGLVIASIGAFLSLALLFSECQKMKELTREDPAITRYKESIRIRDEREKLEREKLNQR